MLNVDETRWLEAHPPGVAHYATCSLGAKLLRVSYEQESKSIEDTHVGSNIKGWLKT